MPEVTRMRRYIRDAIITVKSSIDERPLEFNFNKIDVQISRSHLQKGFKRMYGCSLKSYEKKKRLEAALMMLEEGRLTLAVIAHKCGYRSQSSFTRAFKDEIGMTPTEWDNFYIGNISKDDAKNEERK
jgi:AraC-like DNA-binding protein